MPRKSITDMIPDIDELTPPPEPDAVAPPSPVEESPQAEVPPREDRRGRTRRGARQPRTESAVTPQASTRPAARDLAAPARRNIPREALKVDVPAELALLQRLHRRRLDTGMDLRDQVAIAVDEWLTSQGY